MTAKINEDKKVTSVQKKTRIHFLYKQLIQKVKRENKLNMRKRKTEAGPKYTEV